MKDICINSIICPQCSVTKKPVRSEGLINSNLKLTPLTKDVVSFRGSQPAGSELKYVDEAKIHEIVKEFSNQVIKTYQTKMRLMPADLQKIVKPLIPEKADIQIQHMPQEQMGAAAFCASGIDSSGKQITALFVDFNIFAPKLIQDLAHEFTHALQMLTEKHEKFMDKSLARGEEKHFALEEAANAYEDKLLYVINEVLPKLEDEINAKLMSNKYTPDQILDEYKLVDDRMFLEGLNEVMQKHSLKEDPLALEYFYNKATKESQAYKEGNDAFKDAHHFNQMQYAFDLLPVMYERWAKFLKSQIAEQKKSCAKPLMLFA